jgi:cytochrome c oxidase cbb3-type subunit 3
LAKAEGPGPYDENAYSISQGQRLFSQYNCVGCHAHGGGGMGPALIDDNWIYGSEPENIYNTILEGRPNGMPSFGGHIPEQQAWQIVAYVRSMGRLVPKAAASGRSDHLYSGESPQSSEPGKELRQQAEHDQ